MPNDTDPKEPLSLVETIRRMWRNEGAICHVCGRFQEKDPADTQLPPHLCPHGRPCRRSPLAPEGNSTSACPECNASTRVGDVLAEAMRANKQGGKENA